MSFSDTEELMGRRRQTESEVAAHLVKQQAKAAIAQAKSALQRYESLSKSEDFQQFMEDMKDRQQKALDAMDNAETEASSLKAMGEYLGVTRCIQHVSERITSLTAFLTDNAALDQQSEP